MTLSEVELAFFLPLLLALYWALPRRAWLQNVVLCLASLFFYATWSLRLLPLFVVSSVVDYLVLRGFARWPAAKDDASEEDKRKRRDQRFNLLTVGVGQNLGTLIYFKYAGFFADSLNHLLEGIGLHGSLPVLHVALPIGLSFYTMSRIGVLIDTYYERLEPVRSPLVWLTYVTFFPQLISGPIGRGAELLHQYEATRRFDAGAALRALRELCVGFVLKIYVAATVASAIVDPVFSAPGTFTRAAHAAALFGYAVQVFADFAGYSLIAIGVARLFGVELAQNFDFPFLSLSPPEVWRRWHMTLNRWLFDYIYGPLVTGDGFMRGRLGLGFLVVMAISGLWHGATVNFVLWGLLHGVWLLAHYRYDLYYKSLCRKDRSWVARRKTTGYKLAGWALTVGFFTLTLLPFRAPNLGAVGAFARGMVLGGGTDKLDGVTLHPILGILLVVGYHVKELPAFARFRERATAAPPLVRGLALGLAILFLLLFAPIGAGTFIYAQF